jgi:hypothetical protein
METVRGRLPERFFANLPPIAPQEPITVSREANMPEKRKYSQGEIARMAGIKTGSVSYALDVILSGRPLTGAAQKLQTMLDQLGVTAEELRGKAPQPKQPAPELNDPAPELNDPATELNNTAPEPATPEPPAPVPATPAPDVPPTPASEGENDSAILRPVNSKSGTRTVESLVSELQGRLPRGARLTVEGQA